MSGKSVFDFEHKGIGAVIAHNVLRVPPNQREYSWTEREVTGLFEDLGTAINGRWDEYFLGTVVTVARAGFLEVVDGQQRIATTVILLAAIRDRLKAEKDTASVESIERMLTDIDRRQSAHISRLTLNTDDAAFFQKWVLDRDECEGPQRPSHKRIAHATSLAKKHVESIVSTVGRRSANMALDEWLTFIEHKALVILMKVASEVNAYRMFETLNDRGLKTTQADLVKNYLFGQAGARLSEAQVRWAGMKRGLEVVDENDITVDFLRQALISYGGYLREPDVYERVQDLAKGAGRALDLLAKLERTAQDYTALQNPDHAKWTKYPASMRDALRTVGLLKLKPTRPLLLSVIGAFSPSEAERVVSRLINIGVRLILSNKIRGGSVEQAFAAAAKRVSDDGAAAVKALRKDLAKISPGDAEFRDAFKGASETRPALARYYLRSLELVARRAALPSFVPNESQKAVNLEHILPRRPTGDWSHVASETVDAYCDRLGNLALLQVSVNRDLGSVSFQKKRVAFEKSEFLLTKQIAAHQEWAEKEIEARQATLANLALKAWPIH